VKFFTRKKPSEVTSPRLTLESGLLQRSSPRQREATLIASTECGAPARADTGRSPPVFTTTAPSINLLYPPQWRQPQETAANLVLAADQFVITPGGSNPGTPRAGLRRDEIRTIIGATTGLQIGGATQ